MKHTGEYTGTPDDILARHDYGYDKRDKLIFEGTNPPNYPDWSDRKWVGIWHQHGKHLRDKERSKEQEKREEAMMVDSLKNSLIGRVAGLISNVAREKEEKHQKVQEERAHMKNMAVLRSGDSKKGMKALGANKQYFSLFSREQLVYLWFVLNDIEKDKKVPKKGRANATITKETLIEVMVEKGLPTDSSVITEEFRGLSKDTINDCYKLFARGIRGM